MPRAASSIATTAPRLASSVTLSTVVLVAVHELSRDDRGRRHHLGRRMALGASALARDRRRVHEPQGEKGFQGKRKSYMDSHSTHLLSGALKCGACGGVIALVSGKGSGY
jgi:hypothetical protein